MSSGSFKNVINKMCLEIIFLIYKYEKDLALNNLHQLICHKTKLNQTNQSWNVKLKSSYDCQMLKMVWIDKFIKCISYQ